MHQTTEFQPSQFHIMPGQPIATTDDGVLLQGYVPGFVLYGPYVPMAAGLYNVEVLTDPSSTGSALFDVFAEGRVYGERDLSSTSSLVVRLFDIDKLEIRIKQGSPGFLFKGVRLTPLLFDTDVVAPDEAAALGRSLIDGAVESDAVFAIVDRLIAMGEHVSAEKIEQEFINIAERERSLAGYATRMRASILATFRYVQGLSNSKGTDLLAEYPPSDIRKVLRATKFRIIDSIGIGIADREELLALGYVPEFVNATRLCRTSTEPLRSWQRLPGTVPLLARRRAIQVARQAELDIAYQMDLAFGRGMTAYCPRSGRRVISRHGFVQYMSGMAFIFYYFLGDEPFYVAVGTATGSKIFIYMPETETILLVQDPALRWYSNEEIVHLFRVNLVANARSVVDYLASSAKPAAVYCNNNMGHFIWNDLAGLQAAHDRLALPHICERVELNRQFLPAHEVFPELATVPSAFLDDESAAFRHCVGRKLLPIRFTDTFINERLCDRIRLAAEKNHSALGVPPPPTGKPLLWINLRAHSKIWIDQVSHYTKIINSIAEDHGGVSVFFDGFDDIRPLIDEITVQLGSSVVVHEGLGMSLLDTINWAFAIDAYVCPIGSGLVLVSWIANKPGVTHAEQAHMSQLEWWETVRQSAIPPLAPELSEIRDVGSGLYCNYDLEWTAVLALLRQALRHTHFSVSQMPSCTTQNSALLDKTPESFHPEQTEHRENSYSI